MVDRGGWRAGVGGAVVVVLATLVGVAVAPLGGGSGSVHAQPAPPFTVSPASLDIGPTQAFFRSAPSELQVTNTGATPLTFSVRRTNGGIPIEVTGCTDPVAAGQSCTAQVVLAPTFAVDTIDTSVVVEAAGTQILVPTTLRITPFAQDPPTPAAVDFGAVRNGISSTQTLRLRNWWTRTTSITSAAFPAGSRYSITRSTCTPTVASGAYCEIDITYTPGVHVGPDPDVLTMAGPWGANGATGTEVFPVQASGVAAPIITAAPTSMSFPSQQVGTSSAPVDVVVTNIGNAPLTLQAAVSGPLQSEFAVSGCAGPVPPGQRCTVSTVFTPIGQGVTPRNGVLFLADAQGVATTVQVPFSTDFVLPLDFDPPAVAFPATPVGRVSAPINVRVRNYNTVETPVDGYRLSSVNFAVTSFTCSPKVASGAYCDITIQFQPTTAGAIVDDLIVFGPFFGPPAQEVLKLSGTAGAPSVLNDTGSVRAGATVTIDARANDRDPGGAGLAVPTIVSPPAVGTATISADGNVTYVAPRRIASGTVITIVYSVCDQQGACSTGTIRITITAIGGLLPATGSQTALLAALAACFVGAGLLARRIGQGARTGRR